MCQPAAVTSKYHCLLVNNLVSCVRQCFAKKFLIDTGAEIGVILVSTFDRNLISFELQSTHQTFQQMGKN